MLMPNTLEHVYLAGFELDLQCRQQRMTAIAPMAANTKTAIESTMGSIMFWESGNVKDTRKIEFFLVWICTRPC